MTAADTHESAADKLPRTTARRPRGAAALLLAGAWAGVATMGLWSGGCAETPSSGAPRQQETGEVSEHDNNKPGKSGSRDGGPSKRSSGAPDIGAGAAVPDDLLAAIRADLADLTGLGASALEVLRAERVSWPDNSLGCPQPGQGYLQVITPGYRLVLRADGELHHYHANARGGFIRCTEPSAKIAPVRPRESDL